MGFIIQDKILPFIGGKLTVDPPDYGRLWITVYLLLT